MSSVFVSVVIPCFNEEELIKETYGRVKAVLSAGGFRGFELIFINDGSTDRTLEFLEEISAGDKSVKVISFSRNFGHQAAVSAGIINAKGDIAVIIDADLQDPPELIPEMVRIHTEKGYNVVYGIREKRRGDSLFKKISAAVFYRTLNSLSEIPIPLDAGDFRLIDRKVIDAFKNLKERNKYIRGLISWVGFRQYPFCYTRNPRAAGRTKYPLGKMIAFANTGLLYFTKKPLKIAMTLGFFSIIVGLALVGYVFVAKFSNIIRTVPGWASTIITLVFFGGVQLLTIGVLGEYIGSVFDEVKGRPEYIVDKMINFSKKSEKIYHRSEVNE
jgi:dolichol-phosphate mannosyltransferase